MTAPKHKLKAPASIKDAETDVDALKFFMNEVEADGAMLIYFADDEGLQMLWHGRKKSAVDICRFLQQKFQEFMDEPNQ